MTENEYTPWIETDETDTAYWKRRYLEEVKTTEKLRQMHAAIQEDVSTALKQGAFRHREGNWLHGIVHRIEASDD